MKLLQDRSQTQSFYGRVAVGILILQDEGRRVSQGDATDSDFWDRMSNTRGVRLAVLAMRHNGEVTGSAAA